MNKYVELYMKGLSMQQVADALGCSRQYVQQQLKKEGVEIRTREKKCTDHLGNKFDSEKEMCKHWGVKFATYQTRKSKKWNVEDCLLGQKKKSRGKFIKDHKGNMFVNEEEMCKHWGVKYNTYRKRLAYGYSLEDALTGWVVDHTGNHYSSEEEMCKHWGVKFSTYQQRKYTYKYTLQECLEGRPRTRKKKNEGAGEKHE